MLEEISTFLEIIRHITRVRSYLEVIAYELLRRATRHDLSKYENDEFGGFVELKAQKLEFTSEEYRKSLLSGPIKLHFARNSHHPEYHQNGIDDMELFDIIEMVVDWKAANESYRDVPFDEMIQSQIKRFDMSSEQKYLMDKIVEIIK